MVSAAAVTLVKVLAGCSTFVLVASPSIAVSRIAKNRSVGLVSVVPLLSLLANSHIWMMYGYLSERYFPVFSMFLLGDVLAVAYLAVYWRFTTERAYVFRLLTLVVAFVAVMSLYVILAALGVLGQSRHGLTTTLGYIGDVVAIILYSAPMEKIVQVLRHKSAAFLNVYMVVAGLINNCCWFTYGLVTDNMFILVPNVLFLVISSFSLGLCVVYNPKTHPILPLNASAQDDSVAITIDFVAAGDKVKAGSNLPSPTYELVRSPLEPLQHTTEHMSAER